MSKQTSSRVAFYGRYSTDKQRTESIEDQFLTCQRHAHRQGWDITQHYSDLAHTGADNQRPAYIAMLAAAKRREFDILLVDDLSRLTRDAGESHRVAKDLEFHNIRLVTVSDGLDTAVKGYQFILSFRATQNELYLEDVAYKTRRGLLGKAVKGQHCGGRVYGYARKVTFSLTEVDEFGRPAVESVDFIIDETQAKVVREIFGLYAQGWSPMKIAAHLNAQKIPSLGGKRNPGKTWSRSTIYGDMKKDTGMLNNPLYVGRFRWNRSQWKKEPGTARRVRVLRPEDERVEVERPDLAIIEPALWEAVKQRQQREREGSATIRAALHERARTGRKPSSMLSGIMTCGCCGGNYVVVNKSHYGCARHKERGPAVCTNSRTVSKEVVEKLLIPTLQNCLCSPTTKQRFVEEVSLRLKKQQSSTPNALKQLSQQLATVEVEAANLINAIKQGVNATLIAEALQDVQQKKTELEQQIEKLKSSNKAQKLDSQELEQLYDKLTQSLPAVLNGDVVRARNLIERLTGGIKLIPMEDGRLEAEIRGNLIGLLEEASAGTPHSSKINLVAGAGFEPTTFGL